MLCTPFFFLPSLPSFYILCSHFFRSFTCAFFPETMKAGQIEKNQSLCTALMLICFSFHPFLVSVFRVTLSVHRIFTLSVSLFHLLFFLSFVLEPVWPRWPCCQICLTKLLNIDWHLITDPFVLSAWTSPLCFLCHLKRPAGCNLCRLDSFKVSVQELT